MVILKQWESKLPRGKINPQASNSRKKIKLFQPRHRSKNFTRALKKPTPSLEDDGLLLLKAAAAAAVHTRPRVTGLRSERSPTDPPRTGNQRIYPRPAPHSRLMEWMVGDMETNREVLAFCSALLKMESNAFPNFFQQKLSLH